MPTENSESRELLDSVSGNHETAFRVFLPDPAVNDPTRFYYVSVFNPQRTKYAILLGPFNTFEDADAQKIRAITLCIAVDPWAAFYNYGICSAPRDIEIKTRFNAGGVYES